MSSKSISKFEAERIKVVCRIRPAKNASESSSRRYVNIRDSSTVVVSSFLEPKVFSFDHAAGEETSQEQMFQIVGLPYAKACIEGYNCTILCYGQTGTGKTFTMFGQQAVDDTSDRPDLNQNRGLVPRVLEYLWTEINKSEVESDSDPVKSTSVAKTAYSCHCSFYEIYQEKVFDLLDSITSSQTGQNGSNSAGSNSFKDTYPMSPSTPTSIGSGLKVRDDANNGVYVEGLTIREVASAEEAGRLLEIGCKNRRIGETKMNKKSSRSHAIFLLTLDMTETQPDGTKTTRTSKFSMVDLAGSESHKDTYASGKELKEAGQINKSLSVLGNVINGLAAPNDIR